MFCVDKNNVKQNTRKRTHTHTRARARARAHTHTHTHTRTHTHTHIMKQGDGCVDIVKAIHIGTSIVVAIFFDRDDCRSDI